jgi:hypothetical protein
MTTQPQMNPVRRVPARTLRSHAIGLLGANLAIGALFVWVIPLCLAYWQAPAGLDWSVLRILAPWSAVESTMPVSLLYSALALAAIVIGTVLVIRAAKLVADEEVEAEE